jgi:tryptophan-rich sensory protein
MKHKRNYVLIPVITVLVATIGSIFTNSGMDRYHVLHLPSLAPNGAIIGSIWTVIFILTAISALWVFNHTKQDKRFVWIFTLFIINAILNTLRSRLFFVHHWLLFSIIEMIVLWLITLAITLLIYPRKK